MYTLFYNCAELSLYLSYDHKVHLLLTNFYQQHILPSLFQNMQKISCRQPPYPLFYPEYPIAALLFYISNLCQAAQRHKLPCEKIYFSYMHGNVYLFPGLWLSICKLFTCKHQERFFILVCRFPHNIIRKLVTTIRISFKPVPYILFVKRWLPLPGFISLYRPEP